MRSEPHRRRKRRTAARGWPTLVVAAALVAATVWVPPAAASDKPRWDVIVSNESGSPVRLYQTDNESCWEDSIERIDQGATGSFIGLPLGTVFAPNQTRLVQTTVNNSIICQRSRNFRDFRLYTDDASALRPYDGVLMGFHYHDATNRVAHRELTILLTPKRWAPSPKDGEGPVCLSTFGAPASPFEPGYAYPRDAARIKVFTPRSGECAGSGGHDPIAPRRGAEPRAGTVDSAKRPGRAAQAGRSAPILDVLDLARRGCRLSRKWQADATCEEDGQEDLSLLSTDASNVVFGNDLSPEGFDTYASTSQHNGTDQPGSMTFTHAVTNSSQVTTTTTWGATAGTTISYSPANTVGGLGGSVSFGVNFSNAKGVQSGTATTDTQSWTVPTGPRGTTQIVVMVPTRKGKATYSGTYTIGKPGAAQRGSTPLFRALDMSTSATQPCIGYLVGDASVRQSVMNIAGLLPSYAGADLPGASAYLDDASGFAPTNQAAPCPGFPAMFRSSVAFRGSGIADLGISDAGRAVAQTAFHPDDPKARVRLRGSAERTSGGPMPWIWTSDSPGSRSSGGSGGELITDDSPNDIDTLNGGGGADLLRGSAGADRLQGGSGRDTIEAGAGDDHLVGGPHGDSLDGGPGADVLSDDAGLNRLVGGTGDDRFAARAGRSLMDGGPGDDGFRVAGGQFALAGGPGDDTYHLGPSARADVIERRGGGRDRIVTAGSLDVPFGVERVEAVGARRIRVTSGRSAQTILAGDAGTTIDAGPGRDRVIGGRGDDAITTDAYGADTITTGAGADRVIVRGILTSPGSGVLLTGSTGVRQPPARALARATTRVTDLGPRDRIVLDAATMGREASELKGRMRLVSGSGARPRAAAPTLTYDTAARLLAYDADGTGPSVSRPLLALGHAAAVGRATFVIR